MAEESIRENRSAAPEQPSPREETGQSPKFEFLCSRGFLEWLDTQGMSLAISSYQVGKLLLFGVKPSGKLSIQTSSFDRVIGLWTDGRTIWLATRTMLWRLENCLADDEKMDGYERVFMPRLGYLTGDMDIHDVAVDAMGRPIFVNTRFGCLATVDDRRNFAEIWKPPFLSDICPEDRCHLNGLAMAGGEPKYVTVCGRSDVTDGWRDFKTGGGCVIDVPSGEVVAERLSMPHSPRIHKGELWILNSGTGHLGTIDPETGKFEPVAFVPGYARGLSFHAGYAIVGLSKPRREHTFQDLPLQRNLEEKGCLARCGFQIIELASGACVHWGSFEGVIEELYDVVAIPGVRLAKAMGFSNPALGQQFSVCQEGKIRHWSTQAAA